MPRRRTRKYAKRSARRTGRRRTRKVLRKRVPNAYTNSALRILNYSSLIYMNASSGSYATYTFSCNGMYDPDYTGSGHQPYGFDQLMQYYNYYLVQTSWIKVSPAPEAVATTVPGYFAVVRSPTATAPSFSDADHFREYCRRNGSRIMRVGSWEASMSSFVPTVTCGYRYRKGFGGNSPNETSNWGTSGTNPSSATSTYFHVIYYAIGSDDPAAYSFQIDMGFKAKFFLPKLLPES